MAFAPSDPTQVVISTDVNPTTGQYTGGKHELYSATIESSNDISLPIPDSKILGLSLSKKKGIKYFFGLVVHGALIRDIKATWSVSS